ncbi:MAG: hypothetical protein ABUL68_01355, partial [Pseudomonadota bacterium]
LGKRAASDSTSAAHPGAPANSPHPNPTTRAVWRLFSRSTSESGISTMRNLGRKPGSYRETVRDDSAIARASDGAHQESRTRAFH